MKHIPEVGEKLYIHTPCNSYYVAICRDPYTVESVKGNTMVIRAAKLIFCGPRYYDTLPDRIEDDPNGKRLTFRWSEKKTEMARVPGGELPTGCFLRFLGLSALP